METRVDDVRRRDILYNAIHVSSESALFGLTISQAKLPVFEPDCHFLP